MSTWRAIRNIARLIAWAGGGARAFFVRWFLPPPAVDTLSDDRWLYDDDDDRRHQTPTEPETPAESLPPAPEIRAPEGSEDRQSRSQIPNPFA